MKIILEFHPTLPSVEHWPLRLVPLVMLEVFAESLVPPLRGCFFPSFVFHEHRAMALQRLFSHTALFPPPKPVFGGKPWALHRPFVRTDQKTEMVVQTNPVGRAPHLLLAH